MRVMRKTRAQGTVGLFIVAACAAVVPCFTTFRRPVFGEERRIGMGMGRRTEKPPMPGMGDLADAMPQLLQGARNMKPAQQKLKVFQALPRQALDNMQEPTRRRSWWRTAKKAAVAAVTASPKHSDMDLHDATNAAAMDVARATLRKLLAAAGVFAGLVGLLVATSSVGSLMHTHTGRLIGRSPPVAAATGLAVGALHTLAGPDHFAGLAPLVIGQRRSPVAAFGLGALWGSGHATGQLLIGLVCLAVKIGLISGAGAAALGSVSGFLVGASLIAIGLLGFHEGRQFEADTAEEAAASSTESKPRSRFGWATYATGVLHGLSPDALLFVAPALALPKLAAVLHVAGVVTGTLLSMGICTAALGFLCQRGLGSRGIRRVSSGASGVAVALGVCVLAATFGCTVALPGFEA